MKMRAESTLNISRVHASCAVKLSKAGESVILQ